ncbi:MAG: NADH-quinone oxidoreductase subunit NuoK [Deltaproteobacteria bacterium]|nr:NADH-quinone oxidoreductase subunit NuoK [Deltaproteobacteria bacterium]
MQIGLIHYLTVSAALFGFGLVTVMSRRNAVGILLGVELILNAAALNFVAFDHFVADGVAGQVFAVFIIVLAASEAAIALAIVLSVFRNFRSIMADRLTTLKE